MCGIAGIVSQGTAVNQELFDALTMLQHRVQDSDGRITNAESLVYMHKEKGGGKNPAPPRPGAGAVGHGG